jgi:hypothetical protein
MSRRTSTDLLCRRCQLSTPLLPPLKVGGADLPKPEARKEADEWPSS